MQTSDDYLLGGCTMSPVMIGLSLFATLTSTLSYLAYPGELIKNGPMMFAQLTAMPDHQVDYELSFSSANRRGV